MKKLKADFLFKPLIFTILNLEQEESYQESYQITPYL